MDGKRVFICFIINKIITRAKVLSENTTDKETEHETIEDTPKNENN